MKSNFMQETIEILKKVEHSKIEQLKNIIDKHDEIILIGNGGSNSIASHISQDYTKFLKKKSFSFSDPSRLTCYINDYGMENAYKIFLEEFSKKDTLVILISSAGESKNIYNCSKFCEENNISFIILTGFKYNNSIRTDFANSAKLEFWIDSESYGVVECVHQTILHSVV